MVAAGAAEDSPGTRIFSGSLMKAKVRMRLCARAHVSAGLRARRRDGNWCACNERARMDAPALSRLKSYGHVPLPWLADEAMVRVRAGYSTRQPCTPLHASRKSSGHSCAVPRAVCQSCNGPLASRGRARMLCCAHAAVGFRIMCCSAVCMMAALCACAVLCDAPGLAHARACVFWSRCRASCSARHQRRKLARGCDRRPDG